AVRRVAAAAARWVLRYPATGRHAVRGIAAHEGAGHDGPRRRGPAHAAHMGRPAGHGGQSASRGIHLEHDVLRVPARPSGVSRVDLSADAARTTRYRRRDRPGAAVAGPGRRTTGLDRRALTG